MGCGPMHYLTGAYISSCLLASVDRSQEPIGKLSSIPGLNNGAGDVSLPALLISQLPFFSF